MIRPALALFALILSCQPAFAGGSLEGLTVTLNVETWDDAAAPLLVSEGRTVTVGQGVEFAMGPEGWTGGLDVVPVEVQIGPDRITFRYGEGFEGEFWQAAFNGYVLTFQTGCALFSAARIDPAATTMDVVDGDITVGQDNIRVNVAGRSYGPGATLAVDLDVEDCPMG